MLFKPPLQVLSYDERLGQFEIMFLPRADPKHVCRFNLLFDNEDKAVRSHTHTQSASQ